jgi:hypothetical protein
MLEKRKKFLEKFLESMIENNIKIYNEYTCKSAIELLEFYFKKNEKSEKIIRYKKISKKNLN